MNAEQITTLITTVGFPIVSCGALFWYLTTVAKELTIAINNNTIAITKLIEKQ